MVIIVEIEMMVVLVIVDWVCIDLHNKTDKSHTTHVKHIQQYTNSALRRIVVCGSRAYTARVLHCLYYSS